MYFYDTCSLLEEQEQVFNEHFFISSITLQELEHIKTSANKENDIKFKVRKILRLLYQNQDRFTIIPYKSSHLPYLIANNFIDENSFIIDSFSTDNLSNDQCIIVSALFIAVDLPVCFKTADLNCYFLAKSLINDINSSSFTVEFNEEIDTDLYTGFYLIQLDDEQLSKFYNNLSIINEYDKYNNILINQYLLIQDKDGNIIDQYKKTEQGLVPIPFVTFDSRQFGKVKPKDIYQRIAMDSLKFNQITMLRGSAGSGKSFLAFGYLFDKLEKNEIDKIIIFCNTVATNGSARLGFYPGTRDEKLLDSQIGNLLSSKLGDKTEVERLINEGKLILLPMSDIRGYDTTGMKAGIYISEAQNLDIELMRLALQRIGDDSVCILDGDFCHQVDLPIYAGKNNGMRRASEVFRGADFYGEVELQTIYRSKIAERAELM